MNILNLPKKTSFILILILVVFFLKGVLLSSSFGIFGGQDEARHYNTIQHLAEPDGIVRNQQKPDIQDRETFAQYNFSEEILGVATATGIDALKTDIFNTNKFTMSYIGENEDLINEKNWKPYNLTTPIDAAYGGIQLYHKFATIFEQLLSNQTMLVRFYVIRIISVLLGALLVWFSFLIAINIGLSEKKALLIAAIIAFQPRFSIYFSSINYDVFLIPMFTLFTLTGILMLKQGLTLKNIILFIISISIAISVKTTGYITLVPLAFLLTFLFYKKIQHQNRHIRNAFYFFTTIAFFGLIFFLTNHIPNKGTNFFEILTTIKNYIDKSLTMGRFALSSRTYWGTLGWTNSWLMDNITNLIWFIQTFSVIGLGIIFFSKTKYPKHLPEKKYLIFLIGMIIALQLGIRTADWAGYSNSGSLDIGTPGRYFLPNLAAHIILVFVGLGMLFEWLSLKFKLRAGTGEKLLDWSLIASLILMFSFSTYLIFNVIIYRFYL
ncbi:MAG: phospholipid carrier-dependent glycosyltransferase [Candidatus Moranbacteria bacterium]|nr:phospholipid carrier-dependent glycosyltransferase [Candidatus Moranbacteria bacterium]